MTRAVIMIPDLAVDVLRITDHLRSKVHESCMLKTICLWNYKNIQAKTVFFMVYLSNLVQLQSILPFCCKNKRCWTHSDPTRGFWGGGIFFRLFLVRMHVPRVHMIFSSDFMLCTQKLKFWVILSIFEHFEAKILHFQKILAIFQRSPPASILTI